MNIKNNFKKIAFFLLIITGFLVFLGCKKTEYVTITQDGSFNIFENENKEIQNNKKVRKGSKIIFKIKPEIKENAKKDGDILLYVKKNDDILNPDLFQYEFIANENTTISLYKGELKEYKKITINDYKSNNKSIVLKEVLKDGTLKDIQTFYTDEKKNTYFANLKVGTNLKITTSDHSIIKNYHLNDTLFHNTLDYFNHTLKDNAVFKFTESSFEKTKFNLTLDYPSDLLEVSGLKDSYKKGDKITFRAKNNLAIIEKFLKNGEKIQNDNKELEIVVREDLNIKITKDDIKIYDFNHLKDDFHIINHDEQNKKVKFIYKDFYKKIDKLYIQKNTITTNDSEVFEYEYEDYPFLYKIKPEDIKNRTINFIKKEAKTSDLINFITYELISYHDNEKIYEVLENSLTFSNAGKIRFKKIQKNNFELSDIEYTVKYDVKKYDYQSENFLEKSNPIKYYKNTDLPIPTFKFIANNSNDEKVMQVLDASNNLKEGFELDIIKKSTNEPLKYGTDYEFDFKLNSIKLLKKDIVDTEYNFLIKYDGLEIYKETLIFRKNGINIKSVADLINFLESDTESSGYLFSNLTVDEKIEKTLAVNKAISGNFYKLEFKKEANLMLNSNDGKFFEFANFDVVNNNNSSGALNFDSVNARLENNIYSGVLNFLNIKGGKSNLDMQKFISKEMTSISPVEVTFKNNNDSFLAENLDFSNYLIKTSYIKLNLENNNLNKYSFNIISLKKSNPEFVKEFSSNITNNLNSNLKGKFIKDGKLVNILKIFGDIFHDNFKFKLFEKDIFKNDVSKNIFITDEYLNFFENNLIINPYAEFDYMKQIQNNAFSNFKDYYLNYLQNLVFSNDLILENVDFQSNLREYFINLV